MVKHLIKSDTILKSKLLRFLSLKQSFYIILNIASKEVSLIYMMLPGINKFFSVLAS